METQQNPTLENREICSECEGKGHFTHVVFTETKIFDEEQECELCLGTGYITLETKP